MKSQFVRTRIWVALAMVSLLGAGCSTTLTTEPSKSSRRGGFYLDDGPGAGPPPDVSTIPDATPRPEPISTRANRPYTVFDRQYVPMTALAPYRERGTATWYGRRYHGQRTASGEVYDMYGMTAAHPTLPIPSFARVTHTGSGRTVVVRVNDRGPFLHGRLIDLSWAAAARLGYAAGGSAEVEVELITRFDEPAGATPVAAMPATAVATVTPLASAAVSTPVAVRAPMAAPSAAAQPALVETQRLSVETTVAGGNVATAPPTPRGAQAASASSAATPVTTSGTSSAPSSARTAAPVVGGGHFLQVGAFSTLQNAEAVRDRLVRSFDWLAASLHIRQEGGLFKVHAGPFGQRDEAQQAALRIRQASEFRPFSLLR